MSKYQSGESPEVGDVVECVNDCFTSGDIRVGEQYTVKRPQYDSDIMGAGTCSWRSNRFKLISRATKPFDPSQLDCVGIFEPAKKVHRWPRRWKSDCDCGCCYFEQVAADRKPEMVAPRDGIRYESSKDVARIEASREETYDHLPPETKAVEPISPNSICAKCAALQAENLRLQAECDELRERAEAAEEDRDTWKRRAEAVYDYQRVPADSELDYIGNAINLPFESWGNGRGWRESLAILSGVKSTIAAHESRSREYISELRTQLQAAWQRLDCTTADRIAELIGDPKPTQHELADLKPGSDPT